MFDRFITSVAAWSTSTSLLDVPGALIGVFLPTSNAQRRSLAGLIATAIDEQIPLAPLLRAWAADERGWQSGRVAALAKLLEAGKPLDVALLKVPGALRASDATALRLATRLGTGARSALAGFDDPGSESVEQNLRGTLVYAATAAMVFLIIAAFIAIKITPMFKKIFEDFGMEMPIWSRIAERCAWVVAVTWYVVPLILLVVFLLPLRLRRFVWRQCGLGGLGVLDDARAAAVLGTLGAAAAEHRAPDAALASLGVATDDSGLAARLRRAVAGGSVGVALVRAGLTTTPEGDLIDAERGPHGAWMPAALARNRRQRVLERTWIASELLLPLIVLFMGVFVLMEALGLLTPLYQLIMGLT